MAVEIHLSDMEKGEFETLKAEHFELYQLINKFEPLQVAALEKSTSKPMGRLVVRQGKMQKRLRNDWSLVDFVEADLKINLAIGLDYTLPDGFRSDDTKDLKDQIYSFLKEQDTELGVLNNTIEKLAEAILATDHGEKKIAMLGFENENTPFACTAAEDKYAYSLGNFVFDIEFTSLIESLMNSKKELKNYINGKTRFRMTFEKLLKHHIFKSEKLLNSDIIDFADEFDLYYSNRDNIQTN